jgi:hypothetical protein
MIREAETTSLADYRADEAEAPNRDAMAFAARFLRLVNNSGSGARMPPFSEIARQVGETRNLRGADHTSLLFIYYSLV